MTLGIAPPSQRRARALNRLRPLSSCVIASAGSSPAPLSEAVGCIYERHSKAGKLIQWASLVLEVPPGLRSLTRSAAPVTPLRSPTCALPSTVLICGMQSAAAHVSASKGLHAGEQRKRLRNAAAQAAGPP